MATTITDYSSLLQACKEAGEDYSSEFASYFPAAVGNAEMRLFTEFDLVGKTKVQPITITAGQALCNKPSDYWLARHMFYVDSTTQAQTLVRRKTKDYIHMFWPTPGATASGPIRYYAEESDTQFRIAPTPSTSAIVNLDYEALPARLSTSNTTNIFTKYMPHLLFHACMVELARYMRNQNLEQSHEAAYANAKGFMGVTALRMMKDDGVKVGNPEGQNVILSSTGVGK